MIPHVTPAADLIVHGLILKYGSRLSREQAANALQISVAQVDQRIKSLHLATVRDGKRVFITVESVAAYALQSHD